MISIPDDQLHVNCALWELSNREDEKNRRLYLCGEIESIEECSDESNPTLSPTSELVRQIFAINRSDTSIPPERRKPIVLYINSPGGEVPEGFSLLSTIALSKTPVYTVNIGMWCSMAFLIGITGKKRYSLPYMTFLMHEASGVSYGKTSSMGEKIDFDREFSERIVKQHILSHSCMTEKEYDLVAKKEFYMLPEVAKKYGFIDEIVSDIDTIL